jgi:hypothetical protein
MRIVRLLSIRSELPVILSGGTMALRNHERHVANPTTSDILLPISFRESQHLCGNGYLHSAPYF